MRSLERWFHDGALDPRAQQPSVLVLKGWVFGLEPECLAYARAEVERHIADHHVTHLAWDGDPLQEGSFTTLIPRLLDAHPALRVVIFKKNKSVHKLVMGYAETDAFGNEMRGYGFIRRLAPREGQGQIQEHEILDGGGAPRGVVVGFADPEMDWYELGLKGLLHLGTSIAPGAPIRVVSLGKGDAVSKELSEIERERLRYPAALISYRILPCSRMNRGKQEVAVGETIAL